MEIEADGFRRYALFRRGYDKRPIEPPLIRTNDLDALLSHPRRPDWRYLVSCEGRTVDLSQFLAEMAEKLSAR